MQNLEDIITEIIEKPGSSFKESQKMASAIIEEQEKALPSCFAKLKMIAWDQSNVA